MKARATPASRSATPRPLWHSRSDSLAAGDSALARKLSRPHDFRRLHPVTRRTLISMKMLLSVVAVAGLTLSCDIHNHVHAMMAQEHSAPQSAATAIAGQWQLSINTPHGPMKAAMDVKQDGTKITGKCDMDHMGTLAIEGAVDGKRVTFTLEVTGGQKITFQGAIDGNKMSGTTNPEGGEWTASRV